MDEINYFRFDMFDSFLKFEEICCRLGLWAECTSWGRCAMAFDRLVKVDFKSADIEGLGRL